MLDFKFINIHFPVSEYADSYKSEFSKKASAFFEDIVIKSGISEKANEKLVNEIKQLKDKLSNLSTRHSLWQIAMIVLIMILVIGVVITAVMISKGQTGNVYALLALIWIPSLVVWIFALKHTIKKIKQFKTDILKTQPILSAKQKEAWDMMLPVNRQFQWETVNNLIAQVLPILEIDRFFNRARLDQLCKEYGMENFGDDSSVNCCQSGTINGNPWVIADITSQDWINVTYHGSKTITYSSYESYTDGEGNTKYRWVTRLQTLHATHTEKKPRYTRNKVLIFGFKNDLKDLCFSRKPMNVAGNSYLEKRKIKELQKLARDFKITVMNNDKFDASFYAIDRNDEVKFRTLFDASAQKAIYDLLKDKKEGYGDDFSFKKKGNINILYSQHLNTTEISGDPKRFLNYDLKESRKNFNDFCTEYFRSFFFAFAPIFAADTYQTHNWLDDAFPTAPGKDFASAYECEALANYMDDGMFSPEHADTQNILKARNESEIGDTSSVIITAKAFKIEKCCTYVTKWGRDGLPHDVPVKYDLYVPVFKNTRLKISNPKTENSIEFDEKSKTKEWSDHIDGIGADSKTQVYRRGLAAFISK